MPMVAKINENKLISTLAMVLVKGAIITSNWKLDGLYICKSGEA